VSIEYGCLCGPPADHPLAGWRFWKVFSAGQNQVVIETGAVDRPFGFLKWIGNYVPGIRDDQVEIWNDYLTDILAKIRSAPDGDPGAQQVVDGNFGQAQLEGMQWGFDDPIGNKKQYILDQVCGPAPGGFCRP